MSLVYVGGTFDLFHFGHVELLKKAARYGEVVVALNSDEFVETFKGKRPVMNFTERQKVIMACKYVYGVIPHLSGKDSKPTILSVRPRYIIVGDDWKDKDYEKQMGFTQEWLNKYNIDLIYIPYTKDISTTEIKKRICNER